MPSVLGNSTHSRAAAYTLRCKCPNGSSLVNEPCQLSDDHLGDAAFRHAHSGTRTRRNDQSTASKRVHKAGRFDHGPNRQDTQTRPIERACMLSFRRIFETLNSTECPYVIVGGLAVVLHGHTRLTTDTDLVLDLAAEQLPNLLEALSQLGFQPRIPVAMEEFADGEKRHTWIRDKGMQVFSVYHREEPRWVIDLFAESPIEFSGLLAHAVHKQLEGVRVRVACIDDLVAMKRLAGRDIDLSDIEHLQQIRDMSGE